MSRKMSEDARLAKQQRDADRVPIRPVVSLSPYQAPVVAISTWPCPVCGAPVGERCRTTAGIKASEEQHEPRWRPLQDAHDAGFKHAREQTEGLVSALKQRARAAEERVVRLRGALMSRRHA